MPSVRHGREKLESPELTIGMSSKVDDLPYPFFVDKKRAMRDQILVNLGRGICGASGIGGVIGSAVAGGWDTNPRLFAFDRLNSTFLNDWLCVAACTTPVCPVPTVATALGLTQVDRLDGLNKGTEVFPRRRGMAVSAILKFESSIPTSPANLRLKSC
jgi:hypothetical protein